jgi:hypothetical protein
MRSTEEDFEVFQAHVNYWVGKFGLIGWEIYVMWQDSNVVGMGNNQAVALDIEGRTCTIFLHRTIEHPFNVESDAFHAVGHVFFARVSGLARDRQMSQESLDEELHCILITLWHLIGQASLPAASDDLPARNQSLVHLDVQQIS